MKFLKEVINQAIDREIKASEKGEISATLLGAMVKSHLENEFTREEIFREALTFLFAGFICFLFMHLFLIYIFK